MLQYLNYYEKIRFRKGKVSFNTSALVGLTKDKFKKQYGGALLRETDNVWKQISKFTKEPKANKKSK
jgi:hypothetical protein